MNPVWIPLLLAVLVCGEARIALGGDNFEPYADTVSPTVQVQQGILVGRRLQTVSEGTTYNSFQGIPYAAPPLGNLRFKEPQPPLSWTGIRNATEHGPVCTSVDIFTNQVVNGSEDCLFLNVYSPDLNPSSLLPVMFFIHGGGYKGGSGDDNLYGPDFLIDQNVILVTINYRLGPMGFLSIGTKEVPGNAGFKDQVAALEWVRRNIMKFGGDPNNVTIFGQSAGSASTCLLAISPLSKGLFKRFIALSGSPLHDFNVEFESRRRAFALGKELGLNTNNETELLEFLQSSPILDIVQANPTVILAEQQLINTVKNYHFGPVVEKDFGQNRFLIETPTESVTNGRIHDVDIIIGYTDMEASTAVAIYNATLINTYSRHPELFVPGKIIYKTDPTTLMKVSDILVNHFYGTEPITVGLMKEFNAYVTDTFILDVLRYVRRLTNVITNKMYVYRFTAVSERNVYGNPAAIYGIVGAAHLDDTMYLFPGKQYNLTIDTNSQSYKMVRQTCTLFANFAKYGHPTPDSSLNVTWPEYDSESQAFLDIGEQLVLQNRPEEAMLSFWKTVYEAAGYEF